jgi:RNA polymerase sigma factor (sigma-70 family)
MNKDYGAENFKRYAIEAELFEALMRKDERAIKQFYYEKIPLLYWLACQKISNKEDAVYLARLAFSKTLASDKVFKDVKHITRYMCKAVKYACLDHLKSLKAQKAMPVFNLPLDMIDEALLADEQRPDLDFINQELLKAVRAEVQNLPQPAREMLLLFLEGKKTAEIAEELNCTPRQVRDKLRTLPATIYNELIKNNLITVLLLLLFI